MDKYLTRKVWFTAAAGTEIEGGGSGTTTTSGSTTNAGTAGATAGGTSTADKNTPADTKSAIAEGVEAVIEDRLKRQKQSILGGVDLDKLKADSLKLAELEAERGSDVDKAEARVRKEVTTEITGRYDGVLRGMHVQVQATQLGFRDASDAIAALSATGELDNIKVNPDGSVDVAAIKTKLAKVAENKPYLLVTKEEPKVEPAGSAGIGVTGGGGSGKPESQPGLGRMRDAYANSSVQHKKS